MIHTPDELARRDAVIKAYQLRPVDVQHWSRQTVDTFYRKAVELGFITQPTCEDTDESEILPF